MPPMRNDPFQRLGLDREVLTVSQLNQRARLLLEDVFPQVWVEGELSNLARPASGHVYFTLKDSNAQIRCALFRQNALRVRQALRDGLAVKVRGKISLFEGRGDYQLIADTVEPAGDGALRLAFEALKEKLAGEGLFASERKRPLPAHPRRIGIVSSPSGAVIRDIISVFRRRAPQVELTLVPTAVQGREAVAQIVRALQLADRQGFDALILARGGGSTGRPLVLQRRSGGARRGGLRHADRQRGRTRDRRIDQRLRRRRARADAFGRRRTAGAQRRRPAAASRRPAPAPGAAHARPVAARTPAPGRRRPPPAPSRRTPAPAGAAPGRPDMRLRRAFERQLAVHHERLVRLETRLAAQHPGRTLALLRQKLDSLAARLPRAAREVLKDRRQRLEGLAQTLNVVSPLATLGRGYSILLDERGRAIRDAGQTQPGQRLKARLAEGELEVRVEDNHRTPVTLSLLD